MGEIGLAHWRKASVTLQCYGVERFRSVRYGTDHFAGFMISLSAKLSADFARGNRCYVRQRTDRA